MAKMIPLTDVRASARSAQLLAAATAAGGPAAAATGFVADTLGRPLRDLRISVTDRCNFRCVYCMPKEVFGRDFQFLAHDEMLSFEEIARLARVFRRLASRRSASPAASRWCAATSSS